MNAYSIIHNYDQPVYTPDFDLVQTALGMKQQKLNTNRAKIQSVYDQYASLQVRNEFYQDYIGDRLQQVLDINKQYHNLDLSDDNFASAIAGNVSQILDNQVMGAILDTKRMEAEDKEWEDKRLKGDGSYDKKNHEYALAISDRQRYLQTADFDNRYQGGASFIEFTDYSKKWNDVAKDLKERLGWTYFESSPGVGQFMYQDKKRVVKPEDVRAEMMRVFNSKDLQQMEIDGWNTYRTYDNQKFAEEWNGNVEIKVKQVQDTINTYKAYINSGKLTQTEKTQLESQIEELQGNVTEINKNRFENILEGRTPDEQTLSYLKGSLYKEKYMDGIVRTYAGTEHLDRTEDKVRSEYIKHQHNLSKFAFDQKKFAIEQDRLWANTKLSGAKEGFTWDPTTGEWILANTGGSFDDIMRTAARENEEISPLNLVGEHYNTVRSGMVGVRSAFATTGTDGKEKGWLRTEEMRELIEGINSGDITPKGKYKFKTGGANARVVDFDSLPAGKLDNLIIDAQKAYSSDPKIEAYESVLAQTVKQSVSHFSKMFSEGGDLRGRETTMLPDFRFIVESNKETQQFMTVEIPQGRGRENFKNLLEKKRTGTLTPAQEKTLEAYMGFALSYENSLTEQDRKAYYHHAKNNILGDTKIGEGLPSMTTKPRGGTPERRVEGQLRKPFQEDVRATQLLSTDKYWWNRDYQGQEGQSLRANPIGETIKNSLGIAGQNLKAAWEAEAMDDRTVVNFISSQTTPQLFKDLESASGVKVDGKKQNFAFYRKSGTLYYGVTTTDPKKGVNLLEGEKVEPIFVDQVRQLAPQQVQYLEQQGRLAPESRNFAPGFDAFGQKEVRLGNGAIKDNTAKAVYLQKAEQDLPSFGYTTNKEQEIAKKTLTRYANGDFVFASRYVPGVGYTLVMEDPKLPSENQVVSFRTGEKPPQRLTYEDIKEYKRQSDEYREVLVLDYIDYLIQQSNTIRQ